MASGHTVGPIPQAIPFFRPAQFIPWNPGIQQTNLQVGGPQGFRQGTAQPRAWPYLTGTRQFIRGFPYGSASTLVQPRAWPYGTASPWFKQDSWIWKPATGSGITF